MDVLGIVTHNDPHLDEYMAINLLMRSGEAKFPGIRNALFRTVPNRNLIQWEAALEQGEICVGIGDGPYDEHNKDTKLCCADLVAWDLGIYAEPAIERVLNAVRYADKTADVRRYELSTLIKDWHYIRVGQTNVFRLANHIITDMIRYEELCQDKHWFNNVRTQVRSFTMVDLAKELRATYKGDFENNFALKKLVRNIEEAEQRSLRFLEIFRIINMWQELYSVETHSAVRVWAMKILRYSARRAERFQESRDKYRPHIRIVGVQGRMRGSTIPISIDVQETDERDIAKISRTRRKSDAAVTIIRNSRGNTQVFLNFKKNPDLDLLGVGAELRKAEIVGRGGRPSRPNDVSYWEQLGHLEESPLWYAHITDTGQALYNGSDQSSTEVEPTTLTLEEVVRVVEKTLRFRIRLVA